LLQSTVKTRRKRKILDFDTECRPLTYLGNDFTTSEITAIAASFGPDQQVHCWLLGLDGPQWMLEEFTWLYDQADYVTGHYIRKHDLPKINGALAEYGLPPLKPKMTIDTYLDLRKISGISRSQESLCEMLGIKEPKIGMSQVKWRAANRLDNIELTRTRVIGDVRQHQQLRVKLSELGWLNQPKPWRG